MYGFGGVGLSEVQISISELSVVGGGWWTGQTHFMVGPGRGPTMITTLHRGGTAKWLQYYIGGMPK